MITLPIPQLLAECPFKWNKAVGETGYSFGVADVDFQGPLGVVDYIKSHLSEQYVFYQSQAGLSSAVDTAINYLSNLHVPAQASNIQVMPGTMVGIYAAMRYASRIPGPVVCFGPIYEPIHKHASEAGNEVQWVNLMAGDFAEQVKEKVTRGVAMVAICNPSNPNGHVYNKEELKLISDLCYDNQVSIFSDDLYAPLCFDRPYTSIASFDQTRDQTITSYGFSKAYGLAGFRSGFLFLGDLLQEDVRHHVEQVIVSPSPVTSFVLEFALTEISSKTWVADFAIQARNSTIHAAQVFADHGMPCEVPQGTFFVYPDIGMDDEKFTEDLLRDRHVQVVPGSHFGPMGQNHLRINCATSTERLDAGLAVLVDYWKSIDH